MDEDHDLSRHGNPMFESISSKELSGSAAHREIDGRAMLGFSLTSPDLVICAGSPDIPRTSFGNSPGYLDRNMCSIEISLENGIEGSIGKDAVKRPSVKFASVCETFDRELSPESSFELVAQSTRDNSSSEEVIPVVCINAGSTDDAVILDGVEYSKDGFFTGGDLTRTDSTIGDGKGKDLSLYQTARFGNFSYQFQGLEPGGYVISLHLAEIVFTNGPPGLRVFDVYIQDKKVVSSIDIYDQVGANNPLVISDLRTYVDGDEGLSIRFEGVMGSPIISGIFVAKESTDGEVQSVKPTRMSQEMECEIQEEEVDEASGDYEKLVRDYRYQKSELMEIKRELDELKRENKLKNREYQEACWSLQELRDELMRKSMHVGSLAFAIEGQVKEKSRWFSLLRDLTRKLKIMKMDQIKLSEEAHTYKRNVTDMAEMSHNVLSRLKQHVDLYEDLKIKFAEGEKERKELYNKVLDLKGNIRVFCRCRPLNNEEIAAGALMALDFDSAKEGELTVISNGLPRKTFKFDAVFGPQADQADVFEDTGPFAISVLDGYNVCIFAYGQTGTGKTFTMEGTDDARGVNYRILEEIFNIINEREKLFHYDISVSALEVYNEQIRDLLVSGSQAGVATKRLEVRQIGDGHGHHVPGLFEAHVSNMTEVWEVLQTGSNARAVGSTNANERSSRSHCLHCVMVKGENLLTGECIRSKLWLVDLAGSERIAKTEVQGERLKETQNINRSLSALGDVISALATKSPHVPFRNSKLTHLLQDSLGGDSKTLMFVQISPTETDMGETLCSLNFASRVKGIELGPAKRQLDTSELQRYKIMAEKSKQDLKSKDLQIKKMEDAIHGMDLKMKEKEQKNRTLQEKIKELESELLVERKLARQHVYTKIAEQHQMKQHQDEQNSAQQARPPLANRTLGVNKNLIEELNKEQTSFFPPLVENNASNTTLHVPFVQATVKSNNPAEKENNPEMAENPPLPKRTGRASLCPIARQFPVVPTFRRTSMIPLPIIANPSQPMPASLPLQSQTVVQEDSEDTDTNHLPKQTRCNSPKGIRSGPRKLSTILRRSLQKKIQMKSPLQQQLRRGGINVGTERVRLSFGSRGRMAHRIVHGNGTRAGAQQKQSQKEKERGWNIGTAVKL